MKAVVLVGGEGTRLRPLTETIPKPLVPLVDRPFLHHVLDHLAAHGVQEVVLSSSYLEAAFEAFIDERRDAAGGGQTITWITETTPLGTGGAIANAARQARLTDAFFVLNGDILTDLDLTALLAFHRERGAVATITVSRVDDARPFGLVMLDGERRVVEFREKPAEPTAGTVNAGTYVLDPSAVLDVERDQSVSVEREVFPSLIAAGQRVDAWVSDAYWVDLGTPEKYLRATFDALDGRVGGLSYAAPYVGADASVDPSAHVSRHAVVGRGASVMGDAVVEGSVLLAGASVGAGAEVRGSILGPRATVGARAVVEGAVVAEGGRVPDQAESRGARVSAEQTLQV